MKSTIMRDRMPMCDRFSDDEKKRIANGGKAFVGILYECNDDGWGNPILKEVGHNTVVLGGAILALEHLCNTTATWKPGTINSILNIAPSVAGDNTQSFISGFMVGNGGAALDFSNVYAEDLKQREVGGCIPLREAAVLAGTDAAKYFLKKKTTDGTKTSYYMKEFADATVIKSCWKDAAEEDATGTEIVEEVYNSSRTEGIETFAEFTIGLNIYDIREYYDSIGDMDMARYNTLGLVTGQKVNIAASGEPEDMDYVNVRLFSYLNFENKSVKEKTSATYKYRVYSLV